MIRAIVAALVAVCVFVPVAEADITKSSATGFEVVQEVALKVEPLAAFDAFTGDVRAWWDHSFSENPKKLYIDAKPGGGFWEIFDDEGNGVLHATVTASERGKLLRMVGQLGLAGYPVQMVHEIQFLQGPPEVESIVRVTVRAFGDIGEGWAEAVDGVWHHFLAEQFVPYVESGAGD